MKLSKKILARFLALCARMILARYRPEIIAITGSVGKTSVKDAVFCALAGHFSVGATPHNMNTEYGVPITIIGGERLDVGLFVRAFLRIVFRDSSYPRLLVLEYGADKPGDIEYLVRLAPPQGAILCAIAPAHLQGFKTVEAVAKEKQRIYGVLSARDWFVGDADHPETLPDAACPAKGLLFSAKTETTGLFISQVRERLSFMSGKKSIAVSFKARYHGQEATIELSDCIGEQYVVIASYALGVGLQYGIPLEAIAHSLASYRAPKGRLNPIDGAHGTLIIDDTYNASPSAIKLALDLLERFELSPSARRFAILGDMFELGEQSEVLHREVGEYAGTAAIDFLVCVGPRSRVIADAAAGFRLDESRILRFDDPIVAARAIKAMLQSGDIIVVKGSQGIRLEKCVKELMSEPARASQLLVRQTWKD